MRRHSWLSKAERWQKSLAFRAAAGQINHAFINNSNTYEDLHPLHGSNILSGMTRSRTLSLPA
jgi:hypothetical protein